MGSNSESTVECTSFPDHPEDCRLVLYLTIAALLNGVGRLFQDTTSEHGGWCNFQALWLTYFNWAVLLWVACITVNLYFNVIRSATTEKFERWYHVVSWVVSFLVSLLPFIDNHYGPSGAWCWITGDVGWAMGIWYGPLFASTWTGTYDPENERNQQMLKEDIKPLRLYPVVYVVLSIFPLVNRIQNATSDHHIFALVLLHAISATLQGAAYSLVFAIDRETLRSLTPAQIKAALQSKWAPPIVVREYEIDVTPTAMTTGAESDNSTPTTFENPMAAMSENPSSAAASENPVKVSDITIVGADAPSQHSDNAVVILETSVEEGGGGQPSEDSSTA
ncbi:hypothetical protein BaRGS_00031647 [Batillaria attramentaria]|uniref:G-protein coupled receptors family 2 profile 2 domain-containing protein n=1 Tax=Batillaria attramentaria TaxID=370345 RepID=A0ABD0JQJ1_9CAEN